MPLKIINVVGARPNFVKIAPIMAAYRGRDIQPLLVHTGQHRQPLMSQRFFSDLAIPPPDIDLGVSPGSRVQQMADIMRAFEPIVLQHRPDWVLVVGDVTSTLACALTAAKLQTKVAHVEAGLRSFDQSMPEELNRRVTDSLSDLLFCTEPAGVENLKREGIDPARIHLVGNVMIDTLLAWRGAADLSPILQTLGLHPRRYAVLTLHRPSNVEQTAALERIFDALETIGREMPIIFPAHPRTLNALASASLKGRIERLTSLRIIEPSGYLDFIKLISEARLVLTDSGGVQEETTALGVPCLTLRENTERPITIEQGTNRLVGTQTSAIIAACNQIMAGDNPPGKMPALWDGNTAGRIVDVLVGGGSERVRPESGF